MHKLSNQATDIISGALFITDDAYDIAIKRGLTLDEINICTVGLRKQDGIPSLRVMDRFKGLKFKQLGFQASCLKLCLDFSDANIITGTPGDELSKIKAGMALFSGTAFRFLDMLLDESVSIEIDGTFFRSLDLGEFDLDKYCSCEADDVFISFDDLEEIGDVDLTKSDIANAKLVDSNTIRVGNYDFNFHNCIPVQLSA